MIDKIDHVGIAVVSIEEAKKTYEALGLHVESVEEVPAEGVRVAMIPCGASRIELLEPTSDDSPVAKFLAKRGPGIHHLCLASDDVRADDARLRDGGFHVLRDEPTRGAGGHEVQFVHPRSTGGVLLELAGAAHAGEAPAGGAQAGEAETVAAEDGADTDTDTDTGADATGGGGA